MSVCFRLPLGLYCYSLQSLGSKQKGEGKEALIHSKAFYSYLCRRHSQKKGPSTTHACVSLFFEYTKVCSTYYLRYKSQQQKNFKH